MERWTVFTPGAFAALQTIHQCLFGEIYEFAGQLRTVNIAHPFREGNGRSARIWLDQMLKASSGRAVDWSQVDKEDCLLAMERSPIKDVEIKHLLQAAFTDQVDSREFYMKGIDHSYYYDVYTAFKSEEL